MEQMEKWRKYGILTHHAIEDAAIDASKDKKLNAVLMELAHTKGKFNKLKALIELFYLSMPNTLRQQLANKIKPSFTNEQLPFNFDSYNWEGQINKGREKDVFLLYSKEANLPSYVLKVDYKNQGTPEYVKKIVRHQNEEYRMIREWYHKMPHFIPEEIAMIVSSPRNGKPAAATLQKFFGSGTRDIFKGIGKEELKSLIKNDRSFEREVSKFLDITSNTINDHQSVIDIIGEGNVNICTSGLEHRLLLLDPHSIFSYPNKSKTTNGIISGNLNYLNNIYKEATLQKT